MKKFIALATVIVAAFGLSASTALASTPTPKHKEDICHAKPADTAKNGWVKINVDVASIGYVSKGHQSEHDADIIPAYSYQPTEGPLYVFDGKNLDTLFNGVKGSDILANGCQVPDSPPTAQCPQGTEYDEDASTDDVLVCIKEVPGEPVTVYGDPVCPEGYVAQGEAVQGAIACLKEVTVTNTVYVDRPVTVEKIVDRVVNVPGPVQIVKVIEYKDKKVIVVKYKTKTKVVTKRIVVKTKPKPKPVKAAQKAVAAPATR